MLELIQKIKTYTEAGCILEHMELFDEFEDPSCEDCVNVVQVDTLDKPNGNIVKTEFKCNALEIYVSDWFLCAFYKREA